MPHQTALALDLPPSSTTQWRDFHGFAQFRETPSDPWRFYVCGFDGSFEGEGGFCSVLCTNDTEETVPIDAHNHILIQGRRYGPRFWTH